MGENEKNECEKMRRMIGWRHANAQKRQYQARGVRIRIS